MRFLSPQDSSHLVVALDKMQIKIRKSNLDLHLLQVLLPTRPLSSRKRLSDQLLEVEEPLSHLHLILLSLVGLGRPSLKTNQLRQLLDHSHLRASRASL